MKQIITICALTAFFATASATSITTSKEQLSNVRHSIANVKAALSKQEQMRDLNEQKLRQSELNIARLSGQLTSTQQKLQHEQRHLDQLNVKKTACQHAINQQKQQLAQCIRAVYLLPEVSFLKLLLASNHTKDISRIREYYHYITQSQAATIKALDANLKKLRHYQQQSQQQTQLLRKLKTAQQQQQHTLEALKQHRQQAIDSINNEILTKKQRLALLNKNRRALEDTISQLQHRSKHVHGNDFSQLKGKLQWPIPGKLINHYGSKVAQSELTNTGVMIQSKLQQPVRVIASGTVVFANWLAGYGLLLIVDHGNGYMSLYGRNQNLYKKSGETVHQGEVIASVGKSGGYQQPELYFAIRHNAKPEDPTTWCHNKGKKIA